MAKSKQHNSQNNIYQSNNPKKKIKLNYKKIQKERKKFKDNMNFNKMVALKNMRERGYSSDFMYGDNSSIEDRKNVFRKIRISKDKNYKHRFERKMYHADYKDTVADQFIQSYLDDNSHSYYSNYDGSKYLSDDTLEWVDQNIDLVRNNFNSNGNYIKIKNNSGSDKEKKRKLRSRKSVIFFTFRLLL